MNPTTPPSPSVRLPATPRRAARAAAPLAAAMLAAAAPATRAQLLVYDGFDYPVGTTLPGSAGGFGWSGPWNTGLSVDGFPVISSSLVPPVPGVGVSGGSIRQVLGDPGQPWGHFWSERRLNPITIPIGGELWFSAILQSGTTTRDGSLVLVSFEFQDPSSGESLRLGTYAPSHPAGTPLQWALNESQGVGPFLTAGEPALLVASLSRESNVRYDFDLYVNPPTGPGALPPATPSASFVYGGDYDTLYRVLLVTQHEGLQSGFDEIRVGRSFASVSSAITAVPEPAETLVVTTGLLGIAALLARGRNRSREQPPAPASSETRPQTVA